MCGYRPNSHKIYKSRRWGDCTFARASPVSLSRKPLSLDIEATPRKDLCTYLFRARSFIAKHGVLLVLISGVINISVNNTRNIGNTLSNT